MKKLTLFLFVLFSSSVVYSQDWPDWRGANRDGIWNETGIIEKFYSDTIKKKW